MANVTHDPFQSDPMNDPARSVGQPAKQGWGCFVWGCLGTLTLSFIVMIGSMIGVYYFFTGQVEKYTDTRPIEVPVVEWEPERLEELESRIEAFSDQVTNVSDAKSDDTADENAEDNDATADETSGLLPRELVLTSEEINALISSNEELKGKAFVRIEDGRLYGQITIPTDQIPGGKGRYLNADAEFNVSMEKGILVVKIESASVKGEPLPEPFMDGFSQQNLAKDMYNDVKTAEMLRQFEGIEVVDDSIVLRLREPDTEATATDDEPPATDDVPSESK